MWQQNMRELRLTVRKTRRTRSDFLIFPSCPPFLGRFAVLVASTLCLALILSTGPQVQTYVLSLLNSDVPSVYGSAYQQTLVEFPNLANWLAGVLSWPCFAIGLIVAWFATRSVEPRVVAWNTACASAILLSVFDITLGIVDNKISVRWLTENLVSNFVGGVIVATLLICIFSAAEFAHKHLPVNRVIRHCLVLTTLPFFGLLYCCAAYYLSGLFYAPLPTTIDITASAPADGVVASTRSQATPSFAAGNRPFSFAPMKSVRSNVKWISPEGNVEIRSDFEAAHTPKLEVHMVVGCTGLEQLEKLQTWPSAWITTSGLASLEVVGDTGPTDFVTMLPTTQRADIKIQTGPVATFNLNQEANHQSVQITQFVDKDALVDLRTNSSLRFFLGVPLISANNKEVTLAPRMIKLRVNGEVQFIRLWPPASIVDVPDRTECQAVEDLKPLSIASTGGIDVKRPEAIVGIVVTITQPVDIRRISMGDVGIRVSSSGGWITILGLQAEDLEHESLGQAHMLQVRGNISDFSLDDVIQTPRQVETITAMGTLEAQFVQGKLRFLGQAKRLWKDQGRLNATRWEKLSWEPKLFIISLILSALAVLGKVVTNRLRVNQKMLWMS